MDEEKKVRPRAITSSLSSPSGAKIVSTLFHIHLGSALRNSITIIALVEKNG